jgi:hypothetical protein
MADANEKTRLSLLLEPVKGTTASKEERGVMMKKMAMLHAELVDVR